MQCMPSGEKEIAAERVTVQARELFAVPLAVCDWPGDLRSRECEIVPRPGVMALFPAVQYHYVKPNRACGNRISIAFNVYHPDFRAHYYEGMQQLKRAGAPPRTELER